ncbi:putative Armadillo-type protein [Seiridium unicorne]|uniref:Armadillo-type protein n=1 Tax=Seiridium unicorne TaxID=138068 RepID=A0ABR2USB6_9PEZI
MAVDIISQLGASDAERLAGLGALKNDVVGHLQMKEKWVRAGILRPLVAILDGSRTDQKVKLSALQLIASFASAGATFLPPIHASGALPSVLNCLQDEQPRIVLAALRVLRDVAEACASAPTFSSLDPNALADILFSNTYLDSFSTIIAQADTTREAVPQVTIVARLISTLCREEKHQYALVNHGILDGLATKLASFAVAEGQVVPRAEVIARSENLFQYIPVGAKPGGLHLADILSAIGAIITDSAFRSCRLLYSPSILAVFPSTDSDWGISLRPESRLAGLRPTKQKEYEPMDLLLPYMPNQIRQQQQQQQPPSSARAATSRFHSNIAGDMEFDAKEQDEEEAESPLIPWLISLVRSRDGGEALAAASVLTSLYKCGFAYKSREATLGLLVVPKLLQLLTAASESSNQDYPLSSCWEVIEQTPAILARLITDSELLQKAASDSSAVKTLAKLLKSTYDSQLPITAQLWSPSEDMQFPHGNAADSRLGEAGLHPLLAHRIRVRESTLKAIGAIAAFKEEYRKAVVDQDTVPYIVESLNPSPGRPKQPRTSTENSINEEGSGQFGNNPTSVIIAACYAIRMLSRSVSTLRTTLVDNGVAMPINSLLLHPNIDVQIASSAAICNLVTDFSPMRETLTRANIVKVLCDHARSLNAALRLNALWALKHLVHSASVDLKKTCLEELQSGWLVQLICDDTEDEALFSSRSRDKQAFDDLDEEMEIADDLARPSAFRISESRILRLAETRVAGLREAELNPVRKARQDDLAIQEQGLGFIRNLIGSSHANSNADSTNDTAEMIDFLFNTLGQDRFFNILATKLRVKFLHAFSGRRGAAGSETRVLYPQAKIIEAVVYILVHMAASIPRHRQLVIAQTELLKLLAGLFNSQDREVRVALCHLLNNLTWQDDANDAPACSQRAVELKKLGFLTKLESLGHDDELDVRERAKSALWQMKHG